MRYRLSIFGRHNPEHRHFTDPKELVEWLVDQDEILEVEVDEVR